MTETSHRAPRRDIPDSVARNSVIERREGRVAKYSADEGPRILGDRGVRPDQLPVQSSSVYSSFTIDSEMAPR